MLYRTLKKLKERNGLTDDLKNKIDVFFAVGRITEEQYNDLMEITEENAAEGTEDTEKDTTGENTKEESGDTGDTEGQEEPEDTKEPENQK